MMNIPLPKCEHGVYLGGSTDGRSLYCSWCVPGIFERIKPDDGQPGAWRTCQHCFKTKTIAEFHTDTRTGKVADTCLDCTPRPRVLTSKAPDPGHCRTCGAEIEPGIEPPAELCASCADLHALAMSKIRTGHWEAARELRRIRNRQWPKRNPGRRKEYGLRRGDRYGPGNFTFAAWIEKVNVAGWVCTFCECPLTAKTVVCARWIPQSLGGRNDIENCAPSCKGCAGIFSASWRGHAQPLAA